jgi:hypothetical protein
MPIDKEHAVHIFMERVADHAFDGPIDSIMALLTEGPVKRTPDPSEIELHTWFVSLDDAAKEKVHRIILETAFAASFGLLVILDNLTTGYPIDGQLSDFALYIQTYEDLSQIMVDQPSDKVRINHSNAVDLHDLLWSYCNLKPSDA